VEVDLYYGRGISRETDVLELAVNHGLVSKTGAWYNYGDNRLGQGKEAVRKVLEENSSLFDELRGKILAKLMPVPQEKE